MKPLKFQQSHKELQKPLGMTDEECSSLPVWSDGTQCVSCWKPSFIERVKIAFGGNVWLGVMSGEAQPPVFLSGEEVFEKPSLKSRFQAFCGGAKEMFKKAWESVKNGFKQPDKRKHFVVGFAISVIIGGIQPLIGLILSISVGAAKEYWDSKGHGTKEFMDFVFTCIGGLLAYPFALLIHFLIW